MPIAIDDSLVRDYSAVLKPGSLSGGRFKSPSAESSLSGQENRMPGAAQQERSTQRASLVAALEDLDLGKLSLSDGSKKAESNIHALEDSLSEHSDDNGQACFNDSDSSEEPVVAPSQEQVDQAEPSVCELSDSDEEEDAVEAQDDPTAGQQSGTEALLFEEGDKMTFQLEAGLHAALYVHQVDALEWLWGLWVKGTGGILGDDMGLGKTRTMCSFLAGLTPSKGSLHASIRRPPTDCKRLRRALVVVPSTLIDTWLAEFTRVGVPATRYHGTKRQREKLRARLFSGFKIAVTTYETVLNDAEDLSGYSGCEYFPEDYDSDVPVWDAVVLDEGHKVKNANSKTYKALQDMPARMRIVVTGTPMQNNLMEMHALLDLACPGLLPNRKAFKLDANVIEAGQNKNATLDVKQKCKACAQQLHALFDPFLLRRSKASTRLVTVSAARAAAARDDSVATDAACTVAPPETPALPGKTDLVVWLQLHPVQKHAYQGFLKVGAVSAVLNHSSSALAAISVLKKICDHPALLNNCNALKAVRMPPKASKQGKRGGQSHTHKPSAQNKTAVLCDDSDDDDFAQPSSVASRRQAQSESSDYEDDASSVVDFVVDGSDADSSSEESTASVAEEEGRQPSEQSGAGADLSGAAAEGRWSGEDAESLMKRLRDMHIEDSCKTAFTLQLLKKLAGEGHRTLVFAQSLGMLDMLQRALRRSGMRVLRMDGQSAAVADRQKIVERFQRKKNIPVFLLSAQVGGLGLTITAADRVIILDPSWNPAVDCQSVDRAFRIGQKRHVVVYRLITCGTVEEKIYRRQVFKGGLAKATIEKVNPTKYFSEVELRELFSLDVSALSHSLTAEELHRHHSQDLAYDSEVAAHVASLTELAYTVDTSDHSVLFSRVDASDSAVPSSMYQRPAASQAATSDASSASSAAPVATPSASTSVASGVQPPSAEALQRKKLIMKAVELEQKISDVTAALAATQDGRALGDGGAKLQAALATAERDLSAVLVELQTLAPTSKGSAAGAPVQRSGANYTTAKFERFTYVSPNSKGCAEVAHAPATGSVAASSATGSQGTVLPHTKPSGNRGNVDGSADALADMLATHATLNRQDGS